MPETTAAAPPGDLLRLIDGPDRWSYLTIHTLRRLRDQKLISSWVIGKYAFISAAEVEAWVGAQERPARAKAA